MQREFTHPLLLLFYLVGYGYTQKIFYVNVLKYQFNVSYVLKTHFYYFNSQLTNLDDLKREQLFFTEYIIKYLGIIKRHEPKLSKKHSLIIKK